MGESDESAGLATSGSPLFARALWGNHVPAHSPTIQNLPGNARSSDQVQVWMLTLYAKNVSENIPAHILKKIKEEIDA